MGHEFRDSSLPVTSPSMFGHTMNGSVRTQLFMFLNVFGQVFFSLVCATAIGELTRAEDFHLATTLFIVIPSI